MVLLPEHEMAQFLHKTNKGFPNTSQLRSMYEFLENHDSDGTWEGKDMLELLDACGYHTRNLATAMAIVAACTEKAVSLISADSSGENTKN